MEDRKEMMHLVDLCSGKQFSFSLTNQKNTSHCFCARGFHELSHELDTSELLQVHRSIIKKKAKVALIT